MFFPIAGETAWVLHEGFGDAICHMLACMKYYSIARVAFRSGFDWSD